MSFHDRFIQLNSVLLRPPSLGAEFQNQRFAADKCHFLPKSVKSLLLISVDSSQRRKRTSINHGLGE